MEELILTSELPEKAPDKSRPPMFEIPAGTRPSRCRSYPKCRVAVYWIVHRTPATKKKPEKISRIPVKVDVEGGVAPTATEPGRGHNHFIDCVDRDKWRKKR